MEDNEKFGIYFKDVNVEVQMKLVEYMDGSIPPEILASEKPMIKISRPDAGKREIMKLVGEMIRKLCDNNIDGVCAVDCVKHKRPLHPDYVSPFNRGKD